MDRIEIKKLEVFAHHGVYDEEQRLGQKFVVSAALDVDTSLAGSSDCLEETINYGSIARQITAIMQRENYQLLERVAQVTAMELLWNNELLQGITLRVEKPWAPVGLPLETVSVEIKRSWHDVYIALGSNLGDREEYLSGALEKLRSLEGVKLLEVSDWVETRAYGYTEQPDFLNGCAHLKTTMSKTELLDRLMEIEQEAGRERKIHWGPRTLDLDILFFDDDIIGTNRLILPHPEIEKRMFVLEPMMQIAPWKRHPVSHLTIKQLYENLQKSE